MTDRNAELGEQDIAELEAHGIAVAEADRQLRLLRAGNAAVRLDRPCTAGDGITRLAEDDVARLCAAAAAAAREGRIAWFVPASGAATRMFKDLIACQTDPALAAALEGGGAAATPAEVVATRRFLDNLPRFAFSPQLAATLGCDPRSAAPPRVLEALLGPDGLGYEHLPKGVLPFHAYPAGPLTAFDEQLVEAAELVRDAAGLGRMHVTISPEHEERFAAILDAHVAARPGGRFEVRFSTQDPSTNTLSVDGGGAIVRSTDGRLVFRPAGHGALLGNLAATGAEFLFVKNIDNVAAAPWKAPTYEHARALLGTLLEVQRAAFDLLARLDHPGDGAAIDDARRFAREILARDVDAASVRQALDRPLRVCGMVPNTGEPGGGPFWVVGRDGALSRQIVEGAQVDATSPGQKQIFAASTHFNPVFLACALRDRRGAPYPLHRFVDDDAVIITRKSSGGHELVVLERPGLWNGAMAGWNTLFVEVPGTVFHPVKTVNDLLRPAHQPA